MYRNNEKQNMPLIKFIKQIKKSADLIALYSSKKQNLIPSLKPIKSLFKPSLFTGAKLFSCKQVNLYKQYSRNNKYSLLCLSADKACRAPPWCIVILNPDEVGLKNLRYETLRPG